MPILAHSRPTRPDHPHNTAPTHIITLASQLKALPQGAVKKAMAEFDDNFLGSLAGNSLNFHCFSQAFLAMLCTLGEESFTGAKP